MLHFFLPRWLILFFIYVNSFRMARIEALMDVPAMIPVVPDEIILEVEEPDKPAMVAARLEGDTEDYYIRNTYDIDYLS